NGQNWLTRPDTCGSIGRDFAMTMLNAGVKIQTRAGVAVKTNTLAQFWTSTNIHSYAGVFDPRALYDPFSDRWLVSAATDSHSTNSTLLIGVSRTSNPTNFSDAGWNLREIKPYTDGAFWADYPTLGFNKDWIVLQ